MNAFAPQMHAAISLLSNVLETFHHLLDRAVVVLADAMCADEAVDREHVSFVLDHELGQRANRLFVARDAAGVKLLGDLDLDFTLGQDEQSVADIFFLQLVMLHRRRDALIHGIALVLQIDEHDPERMRRYRVVGQLPAARHRQRLDDGVAALAGAARRDRAGDFTAQQMSAEQPIVTL
jgi:hypothetical protein